MSLESDYDIENSFGMLLDLASQFMRLELNRKFSAAGQEATVEQWKILIFLWSEEGLTQQQIAERTCKNKVSVVKLIDGLERRGLVRRQPDEKDRRINRIFLTKKGRKIQKKLIDLAKKNFSQAVAGINPEEVGVSINVLKAVIENMKDQSCDV